MNLLSYVDSPLLLAVAAVLALGLTAVVVIGRRQVARRLVRLAEAHLLPRLAPVGSGASNWRVARLTGAALLAGVAFAGPRWGEEAQAVRGEGVDVVLALDASLSMLATDETPSRLARLKQEVRRFRDLSRGDRVALLAFAGRSYILTPLTVDDGAIELFLENLDPSIVGQAGSSLARTISQGTELLLATQTSSDRALVVMSDGEGFESPDELVAAATRARENGVSLVTVGFGTEAGSRIPMGAGPNGMEYKRDENDQEVVTRYVPETLRLVAETAQGTFIAADVTDKAARVRAALQGLRRTSRALSSSVSRRPRFQWFVLPALLLLLLDMWRAGRRFAGRTMVLAAGTLMLAGCTLPGAAARDGARAFALGRHDHAAAHYRRAIAKGDARPELAFNLGTALVAGDSLDLGLERLEPLRRTTNEELRFRVLFNVGFGHLRRGLAAEAAGDTAARTAFRAAVDAYKEALLLVHTDPDAKWNYELALRKEEEHGGGGSGGGGGGGGGNSANDRNESDQDSPQARQQSGGLGQQQAEQLLDAAAREERGVQGRKQKDSRPKPPPGGKDW